MLLEMAMRENLYEHVYVVGGVVRRMSTIGSLTDRDDAMSSARGGMHSPTSSSLQGHGGGTGSVKGAVSRSTTMSSEKRSSQDKGKRKASP